MPLDERDAMRLRDMLSHARIAIDLLGAMGRDELEANLAVKLA